MSSMRFRIRFGLDRFSGLYLWAVFIIMFTIWSPLFFTSLSAQPLTCPQSPSSNCRPCTT